jgi:hypothetical protein
VDFRPAGVPKEQVIVGAAPEKNHGKLGAEPRRV